MNIQNLGFATSHSSFSSTSSTSSSTSSSKDLEESNHLSTAGEIDKSRAMIKHFKELSTVGREDDRINLSLASHYIKKLDWPPFYRSLSVQEAVQLHLIKLMKVLHDYLGSNGTCLFLYFMSMSPKNSKSFKEFRENLEKHIKEKLRAECKTRGESELQSIVDAQYVELDKTLKINEQLKLLSLLIFNQLQVGQLLTKVPTEKLPLEEVSSEDLNLLMEETSFALSSLAGTVCSTLQETINNMLSDKRFIDLKEVLLSIPAHPLFNLDSYKAFLSKMRGLGRIFKAQRGILNIQLKKLTHQLRTPDSRSSQAMRFQMDQIFTSLRLLKQQIREMAKYSVEFTSGVSLLIPKEQDIIVKQERKPCFLNNNPMLTIEPQSITPLCEGLEGLHEVNQTLTELQRKENNFKESNLAETQNSIRQAIVAQTELLKSISELANQLTNVTNSLRMLSDSREIKRERVISQLRAGAKEIGVNVETVQQGICDLLGLFYTFDYRFEGCTKGIDVLHHLMEQHQERWFASIRREEIDVDVLWLQSLSDDLVYPEVQDSPATEDSLDSKREFKESKVGVVVASKIKSKRRSSKQNRTKAKQASSIRGTTFISSSSSISSSSMSSGETTVDLSPSTYLQRLQRLRRQLLTKPAALEYLPAYLSDAAYHLGVFGSTIDLFKACVSTGQRQFIPELFFGCFRSGAMMSEQLLTYHMIQERSANEHRTHSHLELVSVLDPSSPIRREMQSAEKQAFLALADYGGVFSRYPHHTLALCEHTGKAAPLTLKWLLDPSICSLQEFVRSFIGPALHFMETLSGDSIESFSKIIVEEICVEIEGEPKALPRSLISEGLQTKLASTLHLVPELIKTTQAHIEKINNSRHSLKGKIALALKEVLYHLQGIEVRLNCFICFPQSIYLSAQVDAILTRLQFLDEQIEIALHMIHTGEAIRTHHLELLRGLRDGQEEGPLATTVQHLDIAGGAQYVHFALNSLRKHGVTSIQMPRALTWRTDALDLSLHDCGEGMALTGAKGKSIEVETLRNQVLTTVVNVLEMAKVRLRKIEIS